MNININSFLNMNMMSKDCKVYNEAIFFMPYNIHHNNTNSIDNKTNSRDGDRIHIWHAGIVSYILMDFNSEEIHGENPKYIVEHGHKSVIIDKEDITGTMKQFPKYENVFDVINYFPERPTSFFEINNIKNIDPWKVQEDINRTYMHLFDEKNNTEISEKLRRAYLSVISKKDGLMKNHDDRLIVYYGEPNKIFLDIIIDNSNLKDKKIYAFRERDKNIIKK